MNDGTAGDTYIHSSIPGRLLASSNGVISRALNNLSYTDGAAAGGGGGNDATCSSYGGGLAYSDLPCECGPDGRLLGSAAAYILKWTKVAIKKTANAYLSSPLLLALLPLLVGCIAGFGLAWWWLEGSRISGRNNSCSSNDSDGRNGGAKTHPTSEIPPDGRSSRAFLDIRPTILILTTAAQAMLESLVCMLTTYWKGGNENENDSGGDSDTEFAQQEYTARQELSSDANTVRESEVPLSSVPHHIAVIMDGNRRYGRQRYGSATRGHWDGSKNLADFAKWCMAEGVQVLTVYAFSTENWKRDPDEVAALMAIFVRYCDELREEALVRGIRICVFSTEADRIPTDVAAGLKRMVEETAHCDKFLMNICLSYGSRGEIVNACRSLTEDVQREELNPSEITENVFAKRLLTCGCPDPDIVLRTSGEMRISNFMLWQMAYSEMFFIEKSWPELTKQDLLEVIQDYAYGRKRRYGK